MEIILVPDRLIEAREEARLTQAAVAAQLRVRREQLSKWEHGKANPTLAHAHHLARIYEKSLDWLKGHDVPISTHPLSESRTSNAPALSSPIEEIESELDVMEEPGSGGSEVLTLRLMKLVEDAQAHQAREDVLRQEAEETRRLQIREHEQTERLRIEAQTEMHRQEIAARQQSEERQLHQTEQLFQQMEELRKLIHEIRLDAPHATARPDTETGSVARRQIE